MTAPWLGGKPWGMGGGGGSIPPVLTPVADAEQTGGVPMTRTLEIPLPEISPIPSAQQFNPLGQQSTVGVQLNVAIPGLVQDIPQGQMAVVNGVVLYILNMVATTNVTWTLFYQNSPVPGFTGITMFPRVAPYVANTFDALYRVTGPGQFTASFSNLDGGSYTVGMSISGQLWPIAMDKVWKTMGPTP